MINLDNRYNFRQTIDPVNPNKLYITANVTECLKSIIGDVVLSAQQVLYHGENRENDSSLEDEIVYKLEIIDLMGDISLELGYVLIKFSNGKVIKLKAGINSTNISESLDYAALPHTEIRAKGCSITKYIRGDYRTDPFSFYTVDITNKLTSYFGDILEKAEQLIYRGYNVDDNQVIHIGLNVHNIPEVDFRYGAVIFKFSEGKLMEIDTFGNSCLIAKSKMIGGGN
jgi:hypothetical protein